MYGWQISANASTLAVSVKSGSSKLKDILSRQFQSAAHTVSDTVQVASDTVHTMSETLHDAVQRPAAVVPNQGYETLFPARTAPERPLRPWCETWLQRLDTRILPRADPVHVILLPGRAPENFARAAHQIKSILLRRSAPVVLHVITSAAGQAFLTDMFAGTMGVGSCWHWRFIDLEAIVREFVAPWVHAFQLQASELEQVDLVKIVLPQLFPDLDQAIFLDNKVVIVDDIATLWDATYEVRGLLCHQLEGGLTCFLVNC